jgi:hypothetical protein
MGGVARLERGCKEIIMSSSFASNLSWLAASRSRALGPERSTEEREFARRVRLPRWPSSVPLLMSGLFGVMLGLTAIAAPPTVTVRHMLAEDSQRALLDAQAEVLSVGTDYALPAHWQKLAPSSAAASDSPVACDPAQSPSAC